MPQLNLCRHFCGRQRWLVKVPARRWNARVQPGQRAPGQLQPQRAPVVQKSQPPTHPRAEGPRNTRRLPGQDGGSKGSSSCSDMRNVLQETRQSPSQACAESCRGAPARQGQAKSPCHHCRTWQEHRGSQGPWGARGSFGVPARGASGWAAGTEPPPRPFWDQLPT